MVISGLSPVTPVIARVLSKLGEHSSGGKCNELAVV